MEYDVKHFRCHKGRGDYDNKTFRHVLAASVRNGSELPGLAQIRFHPNLDRGNGSYYTKKLDCWKRGGFTTKNPTFQIEHFGSN
jgi:hypothetical protein